MKGKGQERMERISGKDGEKKWKENFKFWD
jgi:hypothetical protein